MAVVRLPRCYASETTNQSLGCGVEASYIPWSQPPTRILALLSSGSLHIVCMRAPPGLLYCGICGCKLRLLPAYCCGSGNGYVRGPLHCLLVCLLAPSMCPLGCFPGQPSISQA